MFIEKGKVFQGSTILLHGRMGVDVKNDDDNEIKHLFIMYLFIGISM